MRIPPPSRRVVWYRFMSGVIIGCLIGWGFFIYQYGQVYERLMLTISEQTSLINKQQFRITELQSEQTKLNEQNKKNLTIQQVEIIFLNDRNLRLNQLTLFELKQQALEELQFVERKDIESVAKMKELMIRTIENKVFHIGDNKYQLEIKEIYLFTTLQFYVEIVPESKSN